MRPVRGANSGAYSLGGINADCKGRAERCRIFYSLRIKSKSIAFLGRQRQADKTATESGHEIYNLRCYLFGGADEVAFILTVFGVYENDHPTPTKFLQ